MQFAHSMYFSMKKSLSRLALSVVILGLAACATRPPATELQRQENWEVHRLTMDQLRVWELAGRISVQMENEGWSASLFWQQTDGEYKLRIIAPFGRGTVEINGNTESVSLRTTENQIFTDEDVGLLLRENLGWEIPVSALVYWIRGLPEPGFSIETLALDSMGRIINLSQSDWNIKYERYTHSQGYDVPARITLQREGLQLRMNINRWDIPV